MKGTFAGCALLAVCLAWAQAAPAPDRSGTTTAGKTTLTVFAAASLSEAFQELGRNFESSHPGVEVVFNFAGSQQLATQIEHGAAADLYASADERWMGYVKRHGLLEGVPSVFARNSLVVIVPSSNPARLDRLQDLARKGVRLVLAARAVPLGTYSRESLKRNSSTAGFDSGFADRALKNLVSEEESAKQVVAKVQLGEADAGFVYRSDVTASQAKRVKVLAIPEGGNVLATYPVALLKGAPNAGAAREFLFLLLSSEWQQAMEAHGFLPAATAGD